MNYDDPAVEEQWCADRRKDVAAYLSRERVTHGEIGEWPAWHLAPYVSVWAIESHVRPGFVGWWVISGDLPTDYVSAQSIKHPRDAVIAFSHRWRAAAELMASGQEHPEFSVGTDADRSTLGPLLAARAELLQHMISNAEWPEP